MGRVRERESGSESSRGPVDWGVCRLVGCGAREDHRVSAPRLEPELLEHLRVEFGLDGARAVEFLKSAQWLLDSEPAGVPRLGEAIAYACREALDSITTAGKTSDGVPWRELSRSVVDAARRYKLQASIQSEGTEQLLTALLDSIDEIRQFHEEEPSVHQRRLIAVIVDRAGVLPHSGAQPVMAFQDLWTRLNAALHGDCSVATAREMWSECVALLRQIFLPSTLRLSELERLARIEAPGEADLRELLALAGTPVHLQQFVHLVTTPDWLRLLDSAGAFDRAGTDLWWATATAVARFAPGRADEVVAWLADLRERYGADPERARCIASAARRIGRPAADLIREVLNSHQGDNVVVMEAVNTTLEFDASSEAVTELADLLLNESSWRHLLVPEQLADHLAAGIREHNAHQRLQLICYKLRSVPQTDHVLMRLRSDLAGSVSDSDDHLEGERAAALVACTVSMLRGAWTWLSTTELLSLLDPLPDGLRQRLRSWVLSHAPDVDPEMLNSELEQAVCTRPPYGDDLGLVDRAVESTDAGGVTDHWVDALGRAPSIEEVGGALNEANVPREWIRSAQWILLFPEWARGEWAAVAQVLAARLALSDRDQLASRRQVEATISSSPFTAEDLRALEPLEAAGQVAAWRPAPGEWQYDANQLGGALQTAVQQDPDGWLGRPLEITVKLSHPTYIRSYLQGAAEVVASHPISVQALLNVVALVHTRPWPAEALADNRLDYDIGWEGAQRAGLDLIRAMARADVDLGDRADEAWRLIEGATKDRSAGSGILGQVDPLTTAINRPCTRAFETALLFVAAELRAAKPVRPALVALLNDVLRLDGADGAEYRAILAPRLGWIRHALPEWTGANIDLLLGDDAPDGLAQLTVDLAIQWSLPSRWLLENYPDMVRDAVLRDSREALKHFLVAMLWDCPGYQVEDMVCFTEQHLEEHPGLASKAGALLSDLVDHEDVEEDHIGTVVRLWRELLGSSAASSLEGFGWMHSVSALDDELWAQLTLTTLQSTRARGRWLYGVTNRAMEQPVTRTKLALLNAIVRGHLEPWDRYHIAEHTSELLQNASALRDTGEYERLLTALRERDMIRDRHE